MDFKNTRKSMIIIAALIFLPIQALADQREEARELGAIFSRGASCAAKILGQDYKDPESGRFGQLVKERFGQNRLALLDFQKGITEGLAAYARSGGENCAEALEKLVKSYESLGLGGDIYKKLKQKPE